MSASAPVLAVKNLRIEAGSGEGANRTALIHDLSFDVAPGEFVSIVGESGSGKTMAARSILNLLPPGVRRAGGSIKLEGRELIGLNPRAIRAVRGSQIGMVFQEPMASLNPALKIGTQLREGLKLHRRLSNDECRQRCIEILERVQIKNPEHCLSAYPHEFSGGMRQRIMLASVMLLKPKLLIADEPTTALDMLSQRDVMDLMVALARDAGVSVLLITHDLGLVAQYAQRMIVLEQGKLVEIGATAEVLRSPAEPYTQRLVASLPGKAPPRAAEQSTAPVVLRAEQVCIGYAGRPGLVFKAASKQAVDHVDIDVRAHETLALVGASGSGKTSLGRAIAGLTAISSGRLSFEGRDLAMMNSAQRQDFRRATQLVFQDPYSSLNPRMRIGDIIAAPLRHEPGLNRAGRLDRVRAVLDEVGLPEFVERYPHQMSGGQRQRVAIARAIVSKPRLVIADEPVSALDMTIQHQILELFQALQSRYGFACLFITHDLAVVAHIADRVAVMSDGKIVETGTADDVLRNAQEPYTKALLAATPSLAAVRLAS